MCSLGNVQSGKYPLGEISSQGNSHSGKCLVGEMSSHRSVGQRCASWGSAWIPFIAANSKFGTKEAFEPRCM